MPLDPAALRAEAAKLRAEGEAAWAAGEEQRALELIARARLRTEVAVELERLALLPPGNNQGTVSEMDAAVSVSIGVGPGDAFSRAMHGAGYTLRSLAKEVGVSHQFLSLALRGARKLSDAHKEVVQRLVKASFPDGAPLPKK